MALDFTPRQEAILKAMVTKQEVAIEIQQASAKFDTDVRALAADAETDTQEQKDALNAQINDLRVDFRSVLEPLRSVAKAQDDILKGIGLLEEELEDSNNANDC